MPTEPTAKVVGLPVRGRGHDAKSSPSDVIIDIRNLSLTFQTADAPVVALRNINLAVHAHEFVSLIGPSGCGKTTLMRIVADLEQPTEGTVTVNNVSPREARLKRAYGYIFQAPALYPWRNVQRNVELPLIISDHVDWDELTSTILEIAPREVWVTHGREDALIHWCMTRQIKARALDILGYEDEDD